MPLPSGIDSWAAMEVTPSSLHFCLRFENGFGGENHSGFLRKASQINREVAQNIYQIRITPQMIPLQM